MNMWCNPRGGSNSGNVVRNMPAAGSIRGRPSSPRGWKAPFRPSSPTIAEAHRAFVSAARPDVPGSRSALTQFSSRGQRIAADPYPGLPSAPRTMGLLAVKPTDRSHPYAIPGTNSIVVKQVVRYVERPPEMSHPWAAREGYYHTTSQIQPLQRRDRSRSPSLHSSNGGTPRCRTPSQVPSPGGALSTPRQRGRSPRGASSDQMRELLQPLRSTTTNQALTIRRTSKRPSGSSTFPWLL